jgi:glycosyltransferase involved in cell wall biosynthesis
MLNAYCYIQPSDIEGLSPVVLTVMGLGVPLIVSDIDENQYAVQDTALMFKKTNIQSLTEQINYAEDNYGHLLELAVKAKNRALKEFNWESVTDQHVDIFKNT